MFAKVASVGLSLLTVAGISASLDYGTADKNIKVDSNRVVNGVPNSTKTISSLNSTIQKQIVEMEDKGFSDIITSLALSDRNPVAFAKVMEDIPEAVFEVALPMCEEWGDVTYTAEEASSMQYIVANNITIESPESEDVFGLPPVMIACSTLTFNFPIYDRCATRVAPFNVKTSPLPVTVWAAGTLQTFCIDENNPDGVGAELYVEKRGQNGEFYEEQAVPGGDGVSPVGTQPEAQTTDGLQCSDAGRDGTDSDSIMPLPEHAGLNGEFGSKGRDGGNVSPMALIVFDKVSGTIKVDLTGGTGGDGQVGGNGGLGADGVPGGDASFGMQACCSGSCTNGICTFTEDSPAGAGGVGGNGGVGASGGNGGDGGVGGNGGMGGYVGAVLPPSDMYVVFTVSSTAGGTPGRGGEGGEAGEGGVGGMGGFGGYNGANCYYQQGPKAADGLPGTNGATGSSGVTAEPGSAGIAGTYVVIPFFSPANIIDIIKGQTSTDEPEIKK